MAAENDDPGLLGDGPKRHGHVAMTLWRRTPAQRVVVSAALRLFAL